MQKQSNDEYEDFDDFEDWEGDADLINKEDWKGLLKLREQKARSKPDDLYAQERYGEALILNQQYQQALDYITPYYQVYHELEFGIGRIMDALIGLGKTEKDFKWIKEPKVLRLDQSTIDLCKKILDNKKNYTELHDLYFLLMDKADYLTFKEQEISDFLRKKVNDFTCIGESNYYWDLRIKVKKACL
jgi:hypothetical protein